MRAERKLAGYGKKPRIAPGLVKGSTNYFLRRKSSKEAAPKPANTSVPGSGTAWTVKPGKIVELGGVGDAVEPPWNRIDLPTFAPPAAANAYVAKP